MIPLTYLFMASEYARLLYLLGSLQDRSQAGDPETALILGVIVGAAITGCVALTLSTYRLKRTLDRVFDR